MRAATSPPGSQADCTMLLREWEETHGKSASEEKQGLFQEVLIKGGGGTARPEPAAEGGAGPGRHVISAEPCPPPSAGGQVTPRLTQNRAREEEDGGNPRLSELKPEITEMVNLLGNNQIKVSAIRLNEM